MSQRDHIIKVLDKGFRYDERKPDQFRDIEITYGISPNAEGSAKVRVGDTVVYAGVKMSLEKPYPDSPERGNIAVNIELLPLSSPEFEPGPPQIMAIEIARVVDRGIRESGAIDLKKLCVEPGEKVWTAFIDICSINDAGNLRDVASLAALAAIRDTKLPALVDGSIDYKQKTEEGLPLTESPIEVTVCKIGKHFIVDPIPEEEKATDARLTVASLSDGKICALQKGGDEEVTSEDLSKMLDLAQVKAMEIREKL